jgi:hypothetical protein
LTVCSENLSPEFLAIEPKRFKNEYILETGKGHQFSGDYLLMEGIDAAGRAAVYIDITSLDPGETLSFSLTTLPSEREIRSALIEISLAIIGFSEEPTQLAHQSGQAGRGFIPPEGFTLQTVRMRKM